jgi:hypothetical protein
MAMTSFPEANLVAFFRLRFCHVLPQQSGLGMTGELGLDFRQVRGFSSSRWGPNSIVSDDYRGLPRDEAVGT